VKPDWELKCLPPQSTNCLSLSIVDKYALQKHNPHLCKLGARDIRLADFACLFSPVTSHKNAGEDANEDALDELDLEKSVAGLEDSYHRGGCSSRSAIQNESGKEF
jgi:hypothetical protein